MAPCTTCCQRHCLSRRAFLGTTTALALTPARAFASEPARQQPIYKTLQVQPVLVYETPARREHTSWRQWGAIQTDADAASEKERIAKELTAIEKPGSGIHMRSIEMVKTAEAAAQIASMDHDAVLIYAAGGNVRVLEALAKAQIANLMFLRHRSGPVYLWYEIAHPRMLRKTDDAFEQPGMGVEDVVVDDAAEVAWKLRGAYGLKNALGKTIVAVGGPAGWGRGGRKAPEIARETWKLDIRTVTYDDLAERIRRARMDDARVKRCHSAADRYMSQKGVSVETSRDFVRRAFLLTDVFRDLLDEAQTDAITINQCMGTIMGISETTACLPLSLLNDEGYMAFCESDFVVIPSGILLRYIANRPVFLNDPTHPHHDIVTLAHCTAPRKMNGLHAEPVRLLTHFESDYGAAPKVEMQKGQSVTNLIPDFANKRWVGFEGEIAAVPFMPICRSQIDVSIPGNTRKLLETMGGFHWMTAYGSYLRESAYALRKLGIELVAV
jgi:hypothetical protein